MDNIEFKRKLRRPRLMQTGFDDWRLKMNTEDLYMEKCYPNINNFFDGGYPLNKIFCISFGESPDEAFFDLISEAAVCDKILMKPFKRRRL